MAIFIRRLAIRIREDSGLFNDEDVIVIDISMRLDLMVWTMKYLIVASISLERLDSDIMGSIVMRFASNPIQIIDQFVEVMLIMVEETMEIVNIFLFGWAKYIMR